MLSWRMGLRLSAGHRLRRLWPSDGVQHRQREHEFERQAGVDVVAPEHFTVREDQRRSDADDIDAEGNGRDDVVARQAILGAEEQAPVRCDATAIALLKIVSGQRSGWSMAVRWTPARGYRCGGRRRR